MNLENFKRVLDHIEAFPESWCQGNWHCGTQHCIAGHAQIMAGKLPDATTAYTDGMEFFAIDPDEADWLFFREGVTIKDCAGIYSFLKTRPGESFLESNRRDKRY